MKNGEDNQNEKSNNNNKNRSIWLQTNNFPLAAHFFVPLFAVVLQEQNVKLPETRFMEEMSYVFLFTFFFTVTRFHLTGRQHFSFSHRGNKILMFFFQQNQYPLLFVSRSSSFSGFQVYVNIKSQSKERLGFVVVFTLLKSGQPAICRRNAGVL